MVAETTFKWVKVLKDGNNKISYEVYYGGYMRYYLTSKCCKCLTMDWKFDPLGPTTTYWVKTADSTIFVKTDPNDGTNFKRLLALTGNFPMIFMSLQQIQRLLMNLFMLKV